MIVPRGRQLLRLILYVGRPLLALAVWDLVIVFAVLVRHMDWVALPHVRITIYGSAISLFLAFRNQSAYARWWEARTLWGAIVNNARSWGRQVVSTLAPQHARRLVHLQIAWVHALRQRLRGLPPWDVLAPIVDPRELTALKSAKNVPVAIQDLIARTIAEHRQAGVIDGLTWRALDETLNDLVDAQGGAERIKNTPMPKQYDAFPRLFTQIYCALLPLALVQDMGWFTPLGSTVVGFMFLALDQIGRDLEDPFDNTIFDVPLTAIATTIETNLRQQLGETTLPAPIAPIDGVLW